MLDCLPRLWGANSTRLPNSGGGSSWEGSLSPSIAYPTKFEVEASLRDAKFQIAKRSVSKNKRAKFERIVKKREKQL
jgi:hypothetical protein